MAFDETGSVFDETGADVELFVLAAAGTVFDEAAGAVFDEAGAVFDMYTIATPRLEHRQRIITNIITSTFVSIYKYT